MTDLDLDLSDVLGLAMGVVLDGNTLEDDALGISARPGAAALTVLQQLEATPTLRDLTAAVSTGDSPLEPAEVLAVLEGLDDLAALEVRRPLRVWLSPPALIEQMVAHLHFRPRRRPARRHPATVRGVTALVLRQSLLPNAVLGVCTIGLLIALLRSGSATSIGGGAPAAAVLPLVSAMHLLLLLVHEAGHLVALRIVGVHRVVVARRGLRGGLVFPSASHRANQVVAVAGPFSAVAASLLLIAVPVDRGQLPFGFLAYAPVLGGMHLLSLGPWASDGRMLCGRNQATPSLPRPSPTERTR